MLPVLLSGLSMLSFYRQNARWLLGGFLLTMFSAFGQTFFISIWGAEIRQTFGLTHGGFGTVYMVATLVSAMSLPIVGRLVDVSSVAVCSVVCILALSLAASLMSVITSVPLLIFTIYLLRLFGQGMMVHISMTAMGRWYAVNRGKAVSAASIGHQASEAVAPSLVVWLAVFLGWRNTWLAAAVMLVFVALPLIFALMRVERVPHYVVDQVFGAHETGRQWTRPEVLGDKLFWLASLGVMSPAFIGTSIWFHQDYLIEINNWPAAEYYGSFALMALTTFLVSLITGFAIDRWSAVQLLPVFMLPLGIACLILANFSAVWAIYATMFSVGVSYGISSSLFGAVWPEVYGIRHLGSIRSIIMAFMVFSSAAGPGVTGIMIDLGYPFQHQLLIIGLYCLAVVMLMSAVSRKLIARRQADPIALSTELL